MSKTTLLLIVAAVLCAIAGAVYVEGVRSRPAPKVSPESSQQAVQIAGKTVRVDIVDTEEAREKGLSGRPGLAPDEGMLFVFEKSGLYPFWMKDMSFPIDIVWLSEEKRVVDMAQNVPPESYPAAFSSKSPALYVLELPAGFAEANKLQIGERVQF